MHYGHSVTKVPHDREIMANEDETEIESLLQV
jgi:hypothetical protein